jgi:hypothetical protein
VTAGRPTPRAPSTREAYSVGNHVVFGRGRYTPGTAAGDDLLAHELVHTIQQRAVPGSLPDRLPVGSPDAPEERAADAMTAPGMLGGTSTGSPVIRRRIEVANPTAAPAGAPKGQTNQKIVRGYIATLCPDFGVAGGKVEPKTASAPTGS